MAPYLPSSDCKSAWSQEAAASCKNNLETVRGLLESGKQCKWFSSSIIIQKQQMHLGM